MALKNFEVNVDDSLYQEALKRAQNEGRPLEQILGGLLKAYAGGGVSTTYTVQRGDSLSRIAQKVYGDPHKYPLIQNANKISDPSRIWVGQVLIIPTIAGASPPPAQPTPSPSPAPAPAPVPAPAPTPPTIKPTLGDYVRAMPAGFRPQPAGGLRAVYQFQIIDASNKIWSLTVANGGAAVAQGQTAPPNVVIGINTADFLKLARGQLNTTQAYREGRIGVRGDLNLARRLADLFGPWAHTVQPGSTPAPAPAPTPSPEPPPAPIPSPAPAPTPQPVPSPSGPVNSTFLNGSFDDYQPYMREGEHKYWREFPESYGAHWDLVLISEADRRIHPMDSATFGKFTQKYFGGGGRDYHIHGKHSQVVTSRYGFDLVLLQSVAAQPGRDYTFSGSIVSFYKGTSGERADNKVFKTIGIDPGGGREWASSTVVWGERDGKDNEWRYPSLRVKAQAGAISVFIRLENTEKDVGRTELNTVHLDNFKLE